MDAVRELFGTLKTIQWQDVLDILLVTYLVYRMVLLVRSTSAMRIAKGFIAILVVSALTAGRADEVHSLEALYK